MSNELEVAIVNLFSSKTSDRNTVDTLYSVADNKVKVIFKDNAVYLYELRADIDLVLVYHLTISKLVYNSRVYEVERIGELANYLHVKHTYNNGMELEPLNHESIFYEPVHSFI